MTERDRKKLLENAGVTPIHEADIMDLLIESCATVAKVWAAELESDWKEGPCSPGLYNRLFTMADHLFDLWRQGEREVFARVGPLVERLMYAGDADVRETVAIGLLEDLWGHPNKPEDFRQFVAQSLGPLGHEAWDSIVRHRGYYTRRRETGR